MSYVVFLIGSPRSGTTILEQILGLHPDIADWYEPYYVWERFFSCEEDDIWDIEEMNETMKVRIHKEFDIFRKKSRKKLVLDKSPSHVFNISTINAIFPDAKWIHIIRDGRDVTLSISKEWNKRKQIVKKKEFLNLLRISYRMLKFQPFFRYKFKAIFHEVRLVSSLNPLEYFNKSRWKGEVGWGPRFKQWRKFLDTHSEIEYNAMQWVKAVEAVRETWSLLPEENKIDIKYEELLKSPKETLNIISSFLGVNFDSEFYDSIPKIKKDNFNKWKKEFTPREIELIKPILNPWLKKLGYIDNDRW